MAREPIHPIKPPRTAIDEDIEFVARRWKEQNEQAALPHTAADALHATVTSSEDSAFERLGSRLIRQEDLFLTVMRLEQRVQVFLEAAAHEPSLYVELLHRAAGAGEPLHSRELEYLAQVQGYLVGELTPVLHDVQQELTNLVLHHPEVCSGDDWWILAQPDGVWQYLQTGRNGQQRVLSVFGLMQRVHDRNPRFPLPDPTLPEHPAGDTLGWVGEIDPLDAEAHRAYWTVRLEARHDQAPKTLASEILRRSHTMAYELVRVAEHLPGIADALATVEREPDRLSVEQQQLIRQYQAYHTVALWIEDHTAGLPAEAAGPELQLFRATLHFAHGDPAGVVGILNAAEIIKETNPDLFLRLIGVAPGQDYSQLAAQRSDGFGSVFHLALYRSLHLPVAAETQRAGMEVFRERVRGLLNFDVTLPELLSISAEQMHAIEQQFKAVASAVSTKPDQFGVAAVALTGAFLSILPGYQLRRDLEQALAAVSLVEREHMLQQLRTAAPNEFIVQLRDLPEVLTADPEIQTVVYERLGITGQTTPLIASTLVLGGKQTDTDRIKTVRDLLAALLSGGSATNERARRYMMHDLRFQLWRTTPTERLLSDQAFYQDAMKLAVHLSAEPSNMDSAKIGEYPEQQSVQRFFEACGAHPQLTHEQWLQWYGRLVADDVRIASSRLQRIYHGYQQQRGEYLPAQETCRRLFAALPAAAAAEIESQVFAIRGRQVELPERPATQIRHPLTLNTSIDPIADDLRLLYGPMKRGSEAREFRPTVETGYRMLQRVFPARQFVQRYGEVFLCTRFGKIEIGRAEEAKLIPYFETLSETERRALLVELCQPDHFEQLNWEGKNGDFRDSYRELMQRLQKALFGYRESRRYDAAYRDLGLFSLSNHDWRPQVLRLAYQYAPDDPHVRALVTGERAIDPLIYHAAFAYDYFETLKWANYFSRELGYQHELVAALADVQPVQQTSATVNNEQFEAFIVGLPPIAAIQGTKRIRERMITHLDEELAYGQRLLEHAEPGQPQQYINRLRRIEVLLIYDSLGHRTQRHQPIADRIDAMRSAIMTRYDVQSFMDYRLQPLPIPEFDRPVNNDPSTR